MRTVFGSWKYVFRNIWFLLPFAVVPAVFMALSLDYQGLQAVWGGFFSGDPRAEFLELFRAWSFLRIHSWLGLIYSILAVVAVIFFMALPSGLPSKVSVTNNAADNNYQLHYSEFFPIMQWEDAASP